ncbi:hypothetical protein CLV59_104436 [Chitinophaga dinghuensis]|uniref:DUF6850 domain-containing protein n=1 Tax=Chitinophaga dinghuensis TaxID=1539050 RepID=A0A327VYS0_9BACT|nr:DUF6850 family outer membrane beta-barrel protein [Chitinophaga dinghuensis]RAJ82211.1 hypothetical protein CLV59_104436 [Chitinophaga dinghuensis]
MRRMALLLCLMMSVGVFAQQQGPTDSVWVYQPAQDRYRWATASIAALHRYGIANTGIVSLEVKGEAGGFRYAQLPEQQTMVGFHSEGIRTLGRFRAYGHFSYSRFRDDSVSWQLQGKQDLNRPYFLAARKAGDFQRQRYLMEGRLAYELLPGKLLIGTGIYYLYNTAFRSQDPRPGTKELELIVSPDIALNTGKHTLGLTPEVGYSFEQTDIVYLNKQYQNNFDSIPERRTWIIMGMGYRQPRPGGDNTIRTTSRIAGLTFSDVYSNNDWTAQLSAGYHWRYYKTGTFLENSLKASNWGTYTLEEYKLQAAVYKAQQHSLQLKVHYATGMDMNKYQPSTNIPPLNGTNYTYHALDAHLKYSLVAHPGAALTPGLDASVQLNTLEKQDFIATQYLQSAVLHPEIAGLLYGKGQQGDRWKLRLSGGLVLPLQTSVSVSPLQMNDMVLDVLYHDYYFLNSKAFSGGIAGQYMTKRLLKTVPVGIAGHVNYLGRLQEPDYVFPEIREVGAYRIQCSVSLNIYL